MASLTIEQYVSLIPAVKHSPKQYLWSSYDAEAVRQSEAARRAQGNAAVFCATADQIAAASSSTPEPKGSRYERTDYASPRP